MAEYIEREAVCRAYMDLCMAKSKLEKSRKGAAFFQSDLLPEVEPTNKELLGIVMAAPAADVAPVVHGRWLDCENHNDIEQCSVCGMIYRYPTFYRYNYCPNCGAHMKDGAK